MKGAVRLPVFIDDARKYVNTTQLRAKYLGASYEAEYCQWQTLHGLGGLMETASLIITPNAYLEGKLIASYPPDPLGDFDFVRAATGTRVNSAGLVDLVPYNLVQQSQAFDNAYWSKYQSTIGANAMTAPNGTLTADALTNTINATAVVYVNGITNLGTNTFSVYLKKGTHDLVFLESSNSTYNLAYFNLVTETIGSVTGFTNVTMENVGDGWFRCYGTFTNTNSTSNIAIGNANGSAGNITYIWGAQVVEGTLPKDYQKTETRLNIPRLDYSNGTCPSLLVEPQRTNIIPYSEDFSNATWFKEANGSGSTPIVTSNYAVAPSGNNTADRIQISNIGGSGSASNYSLVGQYPLTLLATGTATIYLKSNTSSNQNVLMYWGAGQGEVFVVTPQWQRFTLDNLSVSALSSIAFGTRGGSGSFFNGGDEVLDILVWGAQLEAGAYPTSYIPTTSASVTRNADVVSKTGISSLIGQTEGTIFLDVDFTEVSDYNGWFMKDVANFDTFAFIQRENTGIIAVGYYGSGALQARIETAPSQPIGRYKIGFGYKNNDFVLYINGTQIGTDTSGSVSGLMNFLDAHYSSTGSTLQNAIALWKTRLTNIQLAQLTTI
jgi:hypothetical protein